MRLEIYTLENNGTWVIQDLPHKKKALGCMWIYKIKYNSNGRIERHKARPIILGNHQIQGINYNETFSLVETMVTFRTCLVVATNWELYQIDIHNSFMHGLIQEEMYMKLPYRFRFASLEKACKLRKSLCGLKQALMCWFAKLSPAFEDYGFIL